MTLLETVKAYFLLNEANMTDENKKLAKKPVPYQITNI